MKIFITLMLFLITNSLLAQEIRKLYMIRKGSTVSHILPASSGQYPRLTKKTVGNVVKKRGEQLSIRRRRYYKADLIQNEKNGDTIKIDFWRIPSYYDKFNTEDNVLSTDSDNYYHIIEKRSKLNRAPRQYKVFYYRQFEVGVATMPFKYRKGYSITDSLGNKKHVPNDVSTAVNAGLSAGFKVGETLFYNDSKKTHDRYGAMLALFTGPTQISIQETNVTNEMDKKYNELGWQVGSGIWFSRRNVEVGVFYGTDIPLSSKGRDWDYAGKFWLGFGLGYKLDMLSSKIK